MRKFQVLFGALAIALLAMASHPSVAATLRVPEDHKSIQAAINTADAGDTVLVSAGTYHERLRLKPNVTLKSAGDVSFTKHLSSIQHRLAWH